MSRAEILKKYGFSEYKTPEGQTYFYNSYTQESLWVLPVAIQEEVDALNKPAAPTDVTATSPNLDLTKYLPLEKPSAEEDESQFVQMLKDNEVDATWSFHLVIERLVGDKRYFTLTDALAKQRCFDTYLQTRSQDELEKENNSLEKFQVAFLKVLQGVGVKYYSRWSTVRAQIADEAIYKHSVISEKVKRQTFEDYVAKLRADKEKAEREIKDKAIVELEHYLNSLEFINLTTEWNEMLDFIKSDHRFEQNKHFNTLTELDLLTAFESILKSHQSTQLETITQLKKKNYRSDRKCRDNFLSKLQQLRADGRIRANTKWENIYPLISTDEAFIGLLGRNGSNPVEMFNSVVKQEEAQLVATKAIVEQLLIHNNITLSLDADTKTQMLAVKKFLNQNKETAKFDEVTIGLIYERLIADLEAAKRREELRIQQKMINNKDYLRNVLHRWEPSITLDAKWDDFSEKLSSLNEVVELGDEATKQVFLDYIEQVKQRESEQQERRERELARMIKESNNDSRKRTIQQVEPQEELDY